MRRLRYASWKTWEWLQSSGFDMDGRTLFNPSNGRARLESAQAIRAMGGMVLLMAGAGGEARLVEVYRPRPQRVLVVRCRCQ